MKQTVKFGANELINKIGDNMEKFYEAWNYLENHKIFNTGLASRFVNCLNIEVVKVNPKTQEIDDDETKNTQIAVWLECGPYDKNCMQHDIDLDCGADTFENAIVKLARLVKEKYD